MTADDGAVTELGARDVIVAVGSSSKVPPIEGLADTHPWTNEQATLTRELPKSLLVLGGGPTGCELAQVFVRFGVPTTIVQSGPRLVPTEHPRNAETVRFALERDGAVVLTGASCRARPGRRRQGWRARDRPRRRLDGRRPRDPARRRPGVPAGRPRHGALRHRRLRAGRLPARRPAAHRRRALGRGRSRRARAAHAPGPLPGGAGDPHGARRVDRPRLPRAAAGDVHGPGVGVGRRHARPGDRAGHRRVRVRRRLHEEREGILRRGGDRARDDRDRPGDAGARRGGDGVPRRVGGDPRVRRSRSRRT